MELKFEDVLALLTSVINSELGGRPTVDEGYLQNVVELYGERLRIDHAMRSRLVKHLETKYGTRQENGHALKKKSFQQWYPSAKSEISFYYWGRLKAFWDKQGDLPRDVVRSVDDVTDEIMGFLGDPRDKKNWNRRSGLVMGHVQSGKTTNYAALVSKAADAGYKIIIILAGLTNSLRYQTQVRMDKSFVGRSSVSDSLVTKVYDVARHDDGSNPRFPYCGTTQIADFSVRTAKSITAHEGNFADPILFVTKKNKTVLENLSGWLSKLSTHGVLEGPLLLIDDEADNASINTSSEPNKATQINEKIRKLISVAKQSCYVGYTATPFANIFIDPDATDEWEQEDLFPADFIKSLEPPSNYVGAEKLFAENGELYSACVRPLVTDDFEEVLPLKHKSTHTVPFLPESLLDAVREYVIFRAVRIALEEGNKNSSMLVNVSRFINVQGQVHEQLSEFMDQIRKAIDSWAKSKSWMKSGEMNRLASTWSREYANEVDLSWDEVRNELGRAVSSIETKVVNMRGGEINYESSKGEGTHIIAVGGLALARGLTLEGLAVSYVLRNIGAADTLLQMGRWFGYRPGYERLCRIHLTPTLLAHFTEVSESVEELRDDFRRMERLGLTPFEFGLKVRQSPTGIAITAANKMRSSEPILLAEDFSERHPQAHSLFDDIKINAKHLDVTSELVESLGNQFVASSAKGNAIVWTGVDPSTVVDFLAKLDLPHADFMPIGTEECGSLIEAYIKDRSISKRSERWDIAIPYSTKEWSDAVAFPFKDLIGNASQTAFCRRRHSGVKDAQKPKIVKITAKNAVEFGDDDLRYGEEDSIAAQIEKIKIEIEGEGGKLPPSWKLHAKARKNPLLVIHLIDFQVGKSEEEPSALSADSKPIVTVSLLFPSAPLTMHLRPRRYVASVRLLEMLNAQRSEQESDDIIEDE